MALAAQYPFTTNDYILKNANIIIGNDLTYPGDFDSFKGKIQSITQQEYVAVKDSAGVVQRRAFIDSHSSYTYLFNKDKQIKESWKYSHNQVVIARKYFRSFKENQLDSAKAWTKSGKLISSEKWEYNEKNLPTIKRITMLNETRDLPLSIGYEGDKTILYLAEYRNVYRYGQLIARTYLNSQKEFTYEYHQSGALKTTKEGEQNHITKVVDYDPAGNLIHTTHFEYDKEGGLVLTSEESNTYDKNNRIMESITSVNAADSSGIKLHEIYEYEGKNLHYIYHIEKGEKKIATTYRYNKQSDLIAVESEKVKFTYDYSGYDKQDNWTRAVVLRDGDPFYIWERTIQYY
jgi:hypothetical protein